MYTNFGEMSGQGAYGDAKETSNCGDAMETSDCGDVWSCKLLCCLKLV